MTRDEILSMPAGREMDALVAEKVMGQTNFLHPGFYWEERSTEDGDGWNGMVCPRCGANETDNWKEKCTKHYSTDIVAAWEVLTSFKTWSCFDLDQEQYPDEEGDKELCGCTLMTNDTGFGMKRGETMPLAICRAALLAVIGDVDE